MKKIKLLQLLAGLGASVMFPVQSQAGSIDTPVLDAPVAVAEPGPMDAFTGFSAYVGLSSVSNSFDIDLATTIYTATNSLHLPDLAGDGFGLTLGAGYDRAVGEKVSLGAFADYTATGAENVYSGTTAFNGATTSTDVNLKQNYAATVGARVGYLLSEDTLVFGLAGYTGGGFTDQAGFSATDGQRAIGDSGETDFYNHGLTIGMGLETRVAAATFLRLEYRQTNFKEYDLFSIGDSANPSAGGITGRADHSLKTITASFVHRF
jgi:outer membrane immunogenic protein